MRLASRSAVLAFLSTAILLGDNVSETEAWSSKQQQVLPRFRVGPPLSLPTLNVVTKRGSASTSGKGFQRAASVDEGKSGTKISSNKEKEERTKSSAETTSQQPQQLKMKDNTIDLSEHQQNEGGQEGSASSQQQMQQRNLKVPQIHIPPRLKQPNLGWEHHHQATTQLVRDRLGGPKKNPLVSNTPEWKRLQQHVEEIESTHLRTLLQDKERCDAMFAEHDGVYLDYSRQRATLKTLNLLMDLAKRQKLQERIKAMMNGEKINFTEKRAVLHSALRSDRHEKIYVDGQNVVDEVHEVLDQIKFFTEGVRSGEIRGYTGKRLRNIVSVGIGGSYLGPEFLHEVLKTEPEGINSALGYSLSFLANVDPVDVERTCADLDPEETLIVIVSKTFTTAETMLNARTMRQWLWDFMGNDKEVVRKHVVACASTSATENVKDFGIDTKNMFFRCKSNVFVGRVVGV
jgi:hypothetical protein